MSKPLNSLMDIRTWYASMKIWHELGNTLICFRMGQMCTTTTTARYRTNNINHRQHQRHPTTRNQQAAFHTQIWLSRHIVCSTQKWATNKKKHVWHVLGFAQEPVKQFTLSILMETKVNPCKSYTYNKAIHNNRSTCTYIHPLSSFILSSIRENKKALLINRLSKKKPRCLVPQFP